MQTGVSRQDAKVVGLAVVAYGAVALLPAGGEIVLGPLSPSLATGLPVPFGIAFGLPGAIGVAVGVLASDAISGSLASTSAAVAGSHLLMGLIAAQFRPSMVGLEGPDPSMDLSRNQLIPYLVAAGLAAVGGAVVIGWLTELLGQSYFFLVAPAMLIESVVMAIVIGLPLLFAFTATDWMYGVEAVSSVDQRLWNPVYLIGLPLVVWFALGTLGSLGIVMSGFVPDWVLANYQLGFVPSVIEFTAGGRWLQITLGGFMLAWLAIRFDSLERTSVQRTEP